MVSAEFESKFLSWFLPILQFLCKSFCIVGTENVSEFCLNFDFNFCRFQCRWADCKLPREKEHLTKHNRLMFQKTRICSEGHFWLFVLVWCRVFRPCWLRQNAVPCYLSNKSHCSRPAPVANCEMAKIVPAINERLSGLGARVWNAGHESLFFQIVGLTNWKLRETRCVYFSFCKKVNQHLKCYLPCKVLEKEQIFVNFEMPFSHPCFPKQPCARTKEAKRQNEKCFCKTCKWKNYENGM